MQSKYRLPTAACVLAVALLAACTPNRDPATPALSSPEDSAASPPAQQPTASPLASQYAKVKGVLHAMRAEGEYDAGKPAGAVSKEEAVEFGVEGAQECNENGPCAIDLVNCSLLGSDLIGKSDQPETKALTDVADTVVDLELLLSHYKFPESQWRPALTAYEQQQLQLIEQVGQNYDPSGYLPEAESQKQAEFDTLLDDNLKISLNAYRVSSGAAVPIVYVEGGCGAGEVGVNFVTEPKHAKLELITVFDYRLCAAQGKDPQNHQLCDAWNEPAEGMLFDVVGDYRYKAQWADGKVREGKISFTNVEDGQTVTIRKQ